MRTLAVTLMLLFSFAAILAQDAKPTQKEVSQWVGIWVAEQGTEKELAAVLVKLKKADRILSQKPLKALIPDDNLRSRSLRLGVELKTPGLFDAIKKYADSDDEAHVLALAVVGMDKGGCAFVLDRWKAKPRESASYTFADEALRLNSMPFSVLTELKEYISKHPADDMKRQDAGSIIAAQTGELVEDVAEYPKKWKEITALYEACAKPLAVPGIALAESQAFVTNSAVRRIGNNYRVFKAGIVTVTAEPDWDSKNFVLRFWICVRNGAGVKFGLASSQGVWEPEVKDAEWVLRHGNDSETSIPFKPDTWLEVVWTTTQAKNDRVRLARTVACTIGGLAVIEQGTLNGNFKDLTIEAGEGEIVVGGLSLEYAK